MTARQQVVIVGGGTAGWMTALYLTRIMARRQPMDITLVESPDLGIIGVGEATIPTLRQTLLDLGIAEEEFLLATNGGFKHAICFRDWLHPPGEGSGRAEYFHPFEQLDYKDVYAACELIRREGGDQDRFISLTSAQYHACMANKAPHGGPDKQVKGFNYAYHLDAVLFGRLMREHAVAQGVKRIESHISRVHGSTETGIQALELADGTRLEGDLFVDCSGFHRLLLGATLQEPYQDFRKWLPCNRAVAVQVDYEKGDVILPYSIAHAQDSGWIWDIRLSSRRGTGYVFSADHASDEQALATLARYLNKPAESLPARFIDMKAGRARRFWVHNCVAIGLSAGFFEPLESTGIMMIELGIRCLIDNWPLASQDDANEVVRENYNRYMDDLFEEILEFIVMHYRLSQRRDTAFWRDVAHLATPPRLQARLQLWQHKAPSHFDLPLAPAYVFGLMSYLAILRGMRWGEQAYSSYVDPASLGHLDSYFQERQRGWRDTVARLPGHAAYLLSLRSQKSQ